MAILIKRFGANFVYVGRHIDRNCVCGHCGARDITVKFHKLQSDRSRFD